ncbi:TPA: DNA alkylation repair protein [Candidatus Dependentiae bacterium]|nr:MAG: hypothetical protein US03_C0003G0062 [candidate division TM6 bacterium GW2011_GWF2_36_131]KKQ03381.1 MAG: hypothetical protein US13_C0003G0062 [candidate division TM6 bacterium GW2011_GWE2_36_25]KKQ18938.1 MAG: hypothetical protein US32_C0020G0010 [candidate division TM6 bacterium GW2011_GWA2_36_9]HBR70840.1 DNA alkylation repair protein [Candidatus Dependentiae bacterium]HCU00557.1 DNA alkylation repair protein [Candidatus Dependentiae bacterium]
MNKKFIIEELKKLSNPRGLSQMARFGSNPETALGVNIPHLRALAKKIGKNHQLALELWKTNIHEARILAGMIDNPHEVTEEQLEQWVKNFNSWDLCDQVCSNLFDQTSFAYSKASEWTTRIDEFVKRAGFTLMACLAVHDKQATDQKFLLFFPLIKKEAIDERNFVKKAVNWALRQIGKRNLNLNKEAIKQALEIKNIDSKSARWIAADALRELQSEATQKRLQKMDLK